MFPDPVEKSDIVDKQVAANPDRLSITTGDPENEAKPYSDQVTNTETDDTAIRMTEDAATDNDQSDSGEFVVTMLAKAKLEEQGLGVKGRSSPLLEAGTQDMPAFMSHREEDVTADSWRQHRKHIFVLSEAGKPIYSRYGSEEALSSTMGVMMALVSFVQSSDNIIRSVYSGRIIRHHAILFVLQGSF